MLQLIKKNAAPYVLYLVLLLPLMTVAWLIKDRLLGTYQVFLAGLWLLMILVGSLLTAEQREEKTKGYAFLQTLPVKNRDVVAPKFLLSFLTAFVYIGYVYILLEFKTGPEYLFALSRIVMVICAGAGLVLTSLIYIFVFRIGFSRIHKILWLTFFVVILAPVLILEFVLRKLNVDYVKIFKSIVALPWHLWVLVGLCLLALYFWLMLLAIKAKEASKG
ncbi:MAG: ABC-2 transporter permease [Candidatus Aminicenantes bacterium]|jgi:hypothetical protein